MVYEHLHRYMWAAALVSGRRVLDLGSGEGFGASILASQASAVLGIDIDARTVEHSKLNYETDGLQFAIGSALDLSRFEDGSLGAVVAFELIEHVSDQQTCARRRRRAYSADDGLLIDLDPRSSPVHGGDRPDESVP